MGFEPTVRFHVHNISSVAPSAARTRHRLQDYYTGKSMSTSESGKAIVAALLANIGIAATKFVADGISGSASMLAEAIHSVADSGNQVLLLVGGSRSRRAATATHPFGYGRSRYIYAFIVSIVLFSVGGLFSIFEGFDKLREPHELRNAWLPLTVLGVSILLESFSLRTALRAIAPLREGQSLIKFIRHAKSPELPVVALEDIAALQQDYNEITLPTSGSIVA